jgi:hypothetical protein
MARSICDRASSCSSHTVWSQVCRVLCSRGVSLLCEVPRTDVLGVSQEADDGDPDEIISEHIIIFIARPVSRGNECRPVGSGPPFWRYQSLPESVLTLRKHLVILERSHGALPIVTRFHMQDPLDFGEVHLAITNRYQPADLSLPIVFSPLPATTSGNRELGYRLR